MKAKIFDTKKNTTLDLNDKVFKVQRNERLIAQAVLRILSNRREIIANTKDRSEVSGGGRKPFRQKGTGRARAGSNRSPLWIGGGITFGPNKNRNFTKRLNKRMKNLALRSALSELVKNNKLIIVPKLDFPKIATKEVQNFLEKLPIEEGKILVVLTETNANLELSAANLKFIKIVQVSGINLLDLLNYDYLITDKDGIKAIEKQFENIKMEEKSK